MHVRHEPMLCPDKEQDTINASPNGIKKCSLSLWMKKNTITYL